MSQTPTTYGLPKKREQVIEELNLAYANQNLDDQEYERRLQEATMAKSIEELMLVLFDFPSEIKNRLFPRNPAVVTTQPAPGYAYPTPHPNSKIQVILGTDSRSLPEFSNSLPKISAILSTQKLDFRLSQVSEMSINLYIECILSNTTIDLRNEHLDGKHINIYISGLMGELKIMLPRV
ncbi:MAG: DUF1707 domain-containing protein [Bacteroidia bacterium]|nr:DUF1707 domain-containing protein [Bacteroidia bacterium]